MSPRSTSQLESPTERHTPQISRVAAGVDGFRSGHDAAALAATIAEATGADLMLVAVHPDPLLVVPPAFTWKALHDHREAVVRAARDRHAPQARIRTEIDWSVPRALERVAERTHRDLLVVGSSRHAPVGQVQIGKRTRQLLGHARSALAVAPAGLSEDPDYRIGSIGVGFDGGPESDHALALACWLSERTGATLEVRGVVDDRLLPAGSSGLGGALRIADVTTVVEQQCADLHDQADRAMAELGRTANLEVTRGRPADSLLDLSGRVNLVVIGSRRWGGVARVLLGSTGEALMHGARCPVLVVPGRQS